MAMSDEKPTSATAAAGADEDSDDDCPDLEEVNDGAAGGSGAAADAARRAKADKKSKKAMARYGFKYFPGVNKITIRRAQRALFIIKTPDVYRSNTNEQTFIIFGEAKAEEFSPDAHKMLVDQIAAAARQQGLGAGAGAGDAAAAAAPEKADAADAAEDDENVDMTGVQESDVQVVMSSARCSKSAAVAALKKNNNELIKAIMSMTM